jgi:hypothetical protein
MHTRKTNWEKQRIPKVPTSEEDLKTEKERIAEIIKLKKEQESLIKADVRKQEKTLKQDKQTLHRITRERLFYEKQLVKLPARRSAMLSNHRRWAKENTGKAFARLLPTLKSGVYDEVS